MSARHKYHITALTTSRAPAAVQRCNTASCASRFQASKIISEAMYANKYRKCTRVIRSNTCLGSLSKSFVFEAMVPRYNHKLIASVKHCYNIADMKTILYEHARLLILTGLALGLAVIFLLAASESQAEIRSRQAPPVAENKAHTQPAAEPKEEPKEKQFTFAHGNRQLTEQCRLVALYGTPDTPVLGSLGEQPVETAITRVQDLAAQYQPFSDKPICPAFEIIATIAAAEPTPNQDFSREVSHDKLKPWIDTARQAGVYVVLDLQPGHSTFLEQAKALETFLREPHVGLALDPEWRLKPGQKHMKQIGTVTAEEVNQTAEYVAGLVTTHKLPQKLFMIHQFKNSMITDRHMLRTDLSELTWMIQMDGLGAQPTKLETWNTIRQNAPAGLHFGWKNFIDEDKPMLTPQQTMETQPAPWFVSYQ